MIGSVTLVFVFYLYASYALEPTCMDMENTRRKQYRKDYVYSPMNDVFYKQHTELKEYEQARDLCNNEGSELMVPSSWHDVMQLDEIIKKYPDLESVWIGDIFKEDLSTTNPLDKEQQLNHNQHKALTRNATIVDVLKTKQLPFICSVKSDDAPFNSQCNVHGKDASYALEPTCMDMENTRRKQYRKDYVYSPMNDVFYKQHTELKEYEQARDLCNNEGSELMVPSSWHDVMQLDEIIKKYPDLESVWIGDIFKEDLSTTNPLDKEQQLNHNQHKALTRNATIVDVLKTKQLPFICSVKYDDAPFNSQCNVHGKDASYALELTCMDMENTRRKQYRKDYVYSPMNDVFYKQHTELKVYEQARDLCNNEGSELMVPSSWHDVMQLDEIIKKYPDLESVWIGDIFKEDQSTTNPLDKEQQLNHNQHKALTRNATIVDVLKTKQLPFICSVKSDDAPFNSQCNVHGKDYQYMAATRSCYKISGLLMTWNEAYLECQNEGSHLVILNSNIEQEVVFNLVKKMPNIPDDGYLSAGFKAMKTPHDVTRVFKTIFNETLEEAGYNEWAKNEPNNGGGVEDCGSIYMTEGKLNDCACTVAVDYNYYNFAYICEKEIPT